jgi:hypothetical protein
MVKIFKNNPFDRIIPLVLLFLVFTLFVVTSIFGSGHVYNLLGIYPYSIYKKLFYVIFICIILSKYLRTQFLNFIVVNEELAKPIFNKSHTDKINIAVNFLIMFIFCKLYFYFSSNSFFVGTDGQHMLALNKMHYDYSDPSYYFTSNFLQGLGGNIPFPVNHKSDIGYMIGNIGGTFNSNNALTTWFIFFAISVFTLCKSLQINFTTSCIASWVAPILSMLPTSFVFTLIPTLTPHMLTSIGVTNFILSAIFFQTYSLKKSVLRSFLIFSLCLYYLITNPTFILLSFPILLIVVIYSIKNSLRKNLMSEIAIIFVPIFIIFIIGGLIYISGIFLNTSVLFFRNEFVVSQRPLNTISILFSRRELTIVLFIVVYTTAFWVARSKLASRNLVNLVKSQFTFAMILLPLGVLYSYKPNFWIGPAPLYFEFMLWGIYGLFISIFISYYLSKFFKYTEIKFAKHGRYTEKLTFSIPLIIVFVYLTSLAAHQNNVKSIWGFNVNSNKSAIIEFLNSKNYESRTAFRGRTITVFNPSNTNSTSWNEIDIQGKQYFKEFGSDFMQATLWHKKIPTVFEVNQLITPRSYFALTRNLAIPADKQLRDFTLVRKININYLQQIGVKYLISNEELKIGSLLLSENSNGVRVFLYEIPEVNLGNWFATKTIQVQKLSDAEKYFKSITRTADNITMTEVNLSNQVFVPPIDSQLFVDGNKYEIKAQSNGKTLIILPIEFSKCFKFEKIGESNLLGSIPVDIGQLGLIFNKDLHVKFNYKNGPLTNPGCRLYDYIDMKRIAH